MPDLVQDEELLFMEPIELSDLEMALDGSTAYEIETLNEEWKIFRSTRPLVTPQMTINTFAVLLSNTGANFQIKVSLL